MSKGVGRCSPCHRSIRDNRHARREDPFRPAPDGPGHLEDAEVKLTEAGPPSTALKKAKVAGALAILGRLIETYDNAASLCATVTPPTGKPLLYRFREQRRRRSTTTRGRPASFPPIWSRYARPGRSGAGKTSGRTSCLPTSRSERRHFGGIQGQAWFRRKGPQRSCAACGGLRHKGPDRQAPIYRTIRDRLSTAGGLNSIIRAVRGKPLSVEVVFSCMHIGRPSVPRGRVAAAGG